MSRLAAFVVVSGVACGGCIGEVSFDPVGTAASVEGQWTVSGAAPTTESCAALDITHVRVRFFDEGERTFDHPRLVFPCEQGSFDTRPDRVVASGQWTMQLLAVNAAAPVGESNVVASGEQQLADTLDARGHIVLDPVDFVATLDGGMLAPDGG